jgi:hypothetical protein
MKTINTIIFAAILLTLSGAWASTYKKSDLSEYSHMHVIRDGLACREFPGRSTRVLAKFVRNQVIDNSGRFGKEPTRYHVDSVGDTWMTKTTATDFENTLESKVNCSGWLPSARMRQICMWPVR